MSFWNKVKEAVAGAPMPSAERREALRKVEPLEPTAPVELTGPTDSIAPFAAGQVWSYRTRAGEEGSTVHVLLVGTIADRVVVHVAVHGLHVLAPDGSVIEEVAHLPMAEEALRGSVLRLLASEAEAGSLEGYEEWQKAEDLSMFTLSLDEVVGMLESMMSGGDG